MSPAVVTLDMTADFDPASTPGPTRTTTTTTSTPLVSTSLNAVDHKTLLLATPALASQQSVMADTLTAVNRVSRPDLYMLDRLAAGLASPAPATYDLVLVLSGADASGHASATALLAQRDVFAAVAAAMKPGARLRARDGTPLGAAVTREAILAGLIEAPQGGGEFTKPEFEEAAVPLRFLGRKKNKGPNGDAAAAAAATTAPTIANGGPVMSPAAPPPAPAPAVAAALPAGVVMVDLDGDFGDEFDVSDDDMIDEEELMTDADLMRPIQQPPECAPKPGKKRRACKDCTCGLAERLEAKDKARRQKADRELQTLKLASEDLNELDFTVQGKTGSCGSCALGDAFRCADCPYIGLPAFKPGEEVTILNNVAQL